MAERLHDVHIQRLEAEFNYTAALIQEHRNGQGFILQHCDSVTALRIVTANPSTDASR